jgi:hypothetical protein
MDNFEVTWEEVLRHFLRKSSCKDELKGTDIEALSPIDAERKAFEFLPLVLKRMKQCTRWQFCLVNEILFNSLKAVEAQTWIDLSNGSLKIVDIAKNLGKKKVTEKKVDEMLRSIATGGFDWRIIIQSNEDNVVLDGVCRALTMTRYFSERHFSPFWAYLGINKTLPGMRCA